MELTGIAGMIVGWCIMVTAYTVFFLGLFYAWNWIIDQLLTKVLGYFRLYKRVVLWIWHMKEFNEWRKRNKN